MLSWNIPDSSERGAQSITSDNQAAENHWQLPVVDLWLAGPCPVIRLKWIKSLAVPNAAILHGLCSAAINWQRSATMQNRRKFNRWHCTAMERGGQWCIGLLKIVGSSPPEKSAIDANEMVIASSIHRLSPHSHRLHFWNSGNLTRKVKKKIVEK